MLRRGELRALGPPSQIRPFRAFSAGVFAPWTPAYEFMDAVGAAWRREVVGDVGVVLGDDLLVGGGDVAGFGVDGLGELLVRDATGPLVFAGPAGGRELAVGFARPDGEIAAGEVADV